MARGKQAERRCCHTERPFARPSRTQASIAQSEWDWAMKRLGWLLGICFGVVFALGIIAG